MNAHHTAIQDEPRVADNLDLAWVNFDPEMPLPGDDHPFYERRPDEPLGRLADALRLSALKPSPAKLFFSGYRGSGKSTELNRLARDERLNRYYFIIRFSVKETGDTRNLDYSDVLLALAAEVYGQYTAAGGQLDDDLRDELETWKNRTVERLRAKGAVFEGGTGLDLSKFFLAALLKVKSEYETRELIREEIRPRLSELIDKINLIAARIKADTGKTPLVLIDDLDKLSLENARRMFSDHLTALMQPLCAIVYTIPIALAFEDLFTGESLCQDTFLLPNVRLHPRGDRAGRDERGYAFLRRLIEKRAQPALFADGVMDKLIALSGGVPSDLVFAVQAAISNALHRGVTRVEEADVAWAHAQLRNPLLRLLSDNDVAVLRQIRHDNPNRLADPRAHARLVHIRAALQYANNPDWFDVHPALEDVLGNGD